MKRIDYNSIFGKPAEEIGSIVKDLQMFFDKDIFKTSDPTPPTPPYPKNNEIWYWGEYYGLKDVMDLLLSMMPPEQVVYVGPEILSEEFDGEKWVITFDGDLTAVGVSSGAQSEQMKLYPLFIGDPEFGVNCNITSIMLPSSMHAVYNTSFWNCPNLSSINIPDGVIGIDDSAFVYCNGLQTVTLPSSITTLNRNCFFHCQNLTEVTFKGTKQQWDNIEINIYWDEGSNISVIHCTDGDAIKVFMDWWDEYLFANRTFKEQGYDVLYNDDWRPYRSDINDYIIDVNSYPIPKDYYYTYCEEEDGYDSLIIHYRNGDVNYVINTQTISQNLIFNREDLDDIEYIEITEHVTRIQDLSFYTTPLDYIILSDSSNAQIDSAAFGYIPNLIYHGSMEGAPWGACALNGYVENGLVYEDSTKKVLCSCYRSTTRATINYGTTTINTMTFNGCKNLTSVNIPSTVNNIVPNYQDKVYNLFNECVNLTSINIDSNNTTYDSRNNCNAIIRTSDNKLISGCKGTTIPSSVTSIGVLALQHSGLVSITIPSTVTSIESSAFRYNDYLTNVVFESRSTSLSLDNCIFGQCSNLREVVLPNNITTIPDYTFESCSNLRHCIIPNSVTTIGVGAFRYCYRLVLDIPDTVTTIGETTVSGNYTFNLVTAISYNGSATGSPWGANYVGYYIDNDFVYANSNKDTLIGYVGDATNITIPNSVTTIGIRAFGVNHNIVSVAIPNTVETIEDGAFIGCNNLTSVTIPNSVRYIGNSAFCNCTRLSSVNFSSNTETIGDYAFEYCEKLQVVDLPDTVTSIGKYAFSMDYDNKSSLKTFICRAVEPPAIGSYMFNTYYSFSIYVPDESVDAYKSADGWSSYSNRIKPLSNLEQ